MHLVAATSKYIVSSRPDDKNSFKWTQVDVDAYHLVVGHTENSMIIIMSDGRVLIATSKFKSVT